MSERHRQATFENRLRQAAVLAVTSSTATCQQQRAANLCGRSQQARQDRENDDSLYSTGRSGPNFECSPPRPAFAAECSRMVRLRKDCGPPHNQHSRFSRQNLSLVSTTGLSRNSGRRTLPLPQRQVTHQRRLPRPRCQRSPPHRTRNHSRGRHLRTHRRR